MIDKIGRRHFIKTVSATMSLPLLPSLAGGAEPHLRSSAIRRVCFINLGFGLNPSRFFPKTTGSGYETSQYLENIDSIRNRFTVFSGLSHDGLEGHGAAQYFLSGRNNSVSVDQLMTGLSKDCRHRSLGISPFRKVATGTNLLAFNRKGLPIYPLVGPERFFNTLFTAPTASEKAQMKEDLRANRSVLDKIQMERSTLKRSVDRIDAQMLEEYYQAIRELEAKLTRSMEWVDIPKPEAPFQLSTFTDDAFDLATMSNYLELSSDLMHLAFLNDTTRVMTAHYAVNDNPLAINGTTKNAHTAYSHGVALDKTGIVYRMENAQFKSLAANFLLRMSQKRPDGSTLLDDTMVLVGSNLGRPSNHLGTNLPILVAGAGFEKHHGQHIAYDQVKNEPLSNLFLTMLHKVGVERDEFGLSNGTLKGINT